MNNHERMAMIQRQKARIINQRATWKPENRIRQVACYLALQEPGLLDLSVMGADIEGDLEEVAGMFRASAYEMSEAINHAIKGGY